MNQRPAHPDPTLPLAVLRLARSGRTTAPPAFDGAAPRGPAEAGSGRASLFGTTGYLPPAGAAGERGILDRRRVMIAEDDGLIACDLAQFLSETGAEIIGPFGTLRQAMSAAGLADAAILDVRLRGGERVFPLADLLSGVGVPFVFYTGYATAIPERFDSVPTFSKTYRVPAAGPRLDIAILDLLPVLRLASRVYLADREEAERLVEQTIVYACDHEREKPVDLTVLEWLSRIMRYMSSLSEPPPPHRLPPGGRLPRHKLS